MPATHFGKFDLSALPGRCVYSASINPYMACCSNDIPVGINVTYLAPCLQVLQLHLDELLEHMHHLGLSASRARVLASWPVAVGLQDQV